MRTNFSYKATILEKPIYISITGNIISVNTNEYCFTAPIYEQISHYNRVTAVYDFIKLADMPAKIQDIIMFYGANSGAKVYVHRLIAMLLGNTNFKSVEMHHRNRDTQDNRPENLLALSKKDHNILHLVHDLNEHTSDITTFESIILPIWSAPENELKPHINISTRKLNRIKTLYEQGYTYDTIAKKCNTSKSTISKVLKTSDIKGSKATKCTVLRQIGKIITNHITPAMHTVKRIPACLYHAWQVRTNQVTNQLHQLYKGITNTLITSLINSYIQTNQLFYKHKGYTNGKYYQYDST